jgi:phospholipase/carboxylesterase
MASNSISLTHLVRQPQQESSGKPPLLILLHGLGSNEYDLFSMAPALDDRFLIVSARAPITMMPGMHAWFNIVFTPQRMIPDLEQAEESRNLLINFIDELIEAYNANPQCVYLMGFSQGAMMSLGVALTHPEKVTGVVAMSGRLPSQILEKMAPAEQLSKLDIIVTHGIYDPVIPIEGGRHCRDELEKLPVDLKYEEYPMEHQVIEAALRDVSSWLTDALDKRCAN